MSLSVCEAIPADDAFLARMFVEAVLWRPELPKVPLEELLVNPELAAYFAGWGRADDVALIALRGSVPAGAGWFRRFTAAAPGYGFVGERIPELGLAVDAAYRRQGIGRVLLRELQRVAAGRGFDGLSLSVSRDNGARALYESLGFVAAGDNGSSVTMCWTVRP